MRRIPCKLLLAFAILLFTLPAFALEEWIEPITGMKFVGVHGGGFQIGDQFGDGKNRRQVTIKPFRLGATEVTQGQWKAIMDSNPSKFKGDDRPVEQVSWVDIQRFIKKFNARHGGKYRFRLPTESEWEYACREGGRKVRFCNGEDTADPSEMNFDSSANYKEPYSHVGEYRQQTTPAGSFPPNSLGLYDMSGNVWEWTCSKYTDRYDGSEERCTDQDVLYSLRGGSWNYGPERVRAASRNYFSGYPGHRFYDLGFRLARD